MTSKSKHLKTADKTSPDPLEIFPGFSRDRLNLCDQVEIDYLDNHLTTKPPLVLLHGIFDNKTTWFRLAEQLTAYRLIAPDLIGHGFSSKPSFAARPMTERYSPDMQTEYLIKFIDALQLDQFVLVGNSLGGGLALRLYLHHPDLIPKIRGIVLISAAGYPQDLPGHIRELGGWQGRLMTSAPIRTFAQWSGLLRFSAQKTMQHCFHDRNNIPCELMAHALAALETDGIFQAYHLSARNIVPDDIAYFHLHFAKIACPTLILWGQQDRVLDSAAARRFAADIPDSAMHLFNGCGHAPHLEYPQETARHIEAWLTNSL